MIKCYFLQQRLLLGLLHRLQHRLQASEGMPVVGIRFRNLTGVDCFISVAVNVIATMERARRRICEEGNKEDISTEQTSGTVSNNDEEIRGNNDHSNGSNRSMTPGDKSSVIKELTRLMKLGGNPLGIP